MKLIFVYNADSGKLNAVFDIAHKLISPNTYKCNLCQLTHETFQERDVWKKFRDESEEEMIFYHRDEFEKEYGQEYEYPIILKEEDGELSLHVSKQKLDEFKEVEELIEHLKST
ncbi:MAG: GTPase [Xenococcaceae cyanobacterium]